MNIKHYFFCFGVFTLINSNNYSQVLNSGHLHPLWENARPFEHYVFIENKGQFSDEEKKDVGEPILYTNRLGKMQLYFTASGITFRYDSIAKSADDNNVGESNSREPEKSMNVKAMPLFLKMTWQNTNPGVEIEVQEPVQDYYTYGNPADKSGHSSILAHAWEKLIYHNLYKNIDVEYTFPEDKGGVEYTIIAHPGADLSNIKMAYSANAQLAEQGNNISIASPGFHLIDHAPVAKDENGNNVVTSFSVNKNEVSFTTVKYDKAKAITIDPWITSTNFFQYNLAYDIAYDNRGNVYIAGGEPPYELQQYDSNGKLNWTYNTVASFGGPSVWYGAMTVDVRSGTTYMVKGLGSDMLAKAVKVNSAGAQVAQNIEEINIELWRVAFDYQNNQLVVGAGQNYTTARVDTALDSIYDIGLVGGPDHDIALLALDNNGNAYMATNQLAGSPQLITYNNIIFKIPLPSLNWIMDTARDHYDFLELLSLYYYPPQINGGYDYANGFNGMAANSTMLITYDGASLKKWRTSNLTLEDSVKVSNTSFQWGGVDIGCDGDIYVGNNNSVCVYDSATLKKIDSIPVHNLIYALKVNKGHLYVCGNGFVQELSIDSKCDIIGTGTDEIKATQEGITIYPNPFTNTTTIAISTGGAYYLEVDDLMGRKLKYVEFTGAQYQLSAQGLAKGLYFIRVFDSNKTPIGTSKIVVQ